MRLRVIQGERFSCHSCTTCCRDWHVELVGEETLRIPSLDWPADDPLRGAAVLLKHSGKVFLAHRSDGSCVFLNLDNGRCRIHEQFGAHAKPLGCQMFPFQIVPTFEAEASVIARYDCPTVRRNIGAEHSEELPNLRHYARELGLVRIEGFDQTTRCFLDREQIQATCEFLVTMLEGFDDDSARALFIYYLCDWLAALNSDELDRAALAGAFGQLKQQVQSSLAGPVLRPGAIHRMAFRSLLGLYLRRDEDVLNRRAGRLPRALALCRIVVGGGDFHRLGLANPSGKLRRAGLFGRSLQPDSAGTFALFWRLIRNQLESFAFMGPANNGRDFLSGLRSLSLLYPLVLGAAKYSAAARGAASIEPSDIDYAVGVIEHSHGRSAILAQPFARSLERALLAPQIFPRLLRGI